MAATVNVNGRITDQEHAVVPVFDHGFLYGEGVYETLRTYHGQPFLFDRHMRRLRRSAELLMLPVPLADAEIDARLRATMRAGGLGENGRDAYLRILVTRGVGDLSYDPVACPSSSVVIIAKPLEVPSDDVFEHGVTAALVPVVRNHPETVSPMIKSNNLLNNALAMQEAVRRGAYEGFMRNFRGELAEGTQSNLFIVSAGVALTPTLTSGLLPGITREFLFEVGAGIGVQVREAVLRDDDLFGADEVFLTSTTRELVPVVRVDDRTIGDGRPGPVTRALLEGFRRQAEALTKRAGPVSLK